MTTIELDRADLAQGMRDATADLRELGLPGLIECARSRRPGMYTDGYRAVLNQAELVAWDLWRASCATQPTHVREGIAT